MNGGCRLTLSPIPVFTAIDNLTVGTNESISIQADATGLALV